MPTKKPADNQRVKVEVAGIEPASGKGNQRPSTCLVALGNVGRRYKPDANTPSQATKFRSTAMATELRFCQGRLGDRLPLPDRRRQRRPPHSRKSNLRGESVVVAN